MPSYRNYSWQAAARRRTTVETTLGAPDSPEVLRGAGDAPAIFTPTRPTLDYRSLLERYMAHVYRSEGSTFFPMYAPPNEFSEGELAELARLDKQTRRKDG